MGDEKFLYLKKDVEYFLCMCVKEKMFVCIEFYWVLIWLEFVSEVENIICYVVSVVGVYF